MHSTDYSEKDVIYKDVVIIGNGPSGICLSYMLAGNWPYYTGEPHPTDDMLTARLNYSTEGSQLNDDDVEEGQELVVDCVSEELNQGLVSSRSELKRGKIGLARCTRCGLECLSNGLEGRGNGKPLALLMDHLQHPCVDAGFDLPPLLDWHSANDDPAHKIIDHVVLGKGPPGGAWQSMDPNVLTISLSRWMSLPGLDLCTWEMMLESEQQKSSKFGERSAQAYLAQEKIGVCKGSRRVPVGVIAAYYEDYVRRQCLDKYFRCGVKVTSIRPVPGVNNTFDDYGWVVKGFEIETQKPFKYRCKKLVLSTGSTDLSNRLGLPNEESFDSFVTHDLNDLENRLDRLATRQRNRKKACGKVSETVDPVLIIGAGLSAADAIIAARFRGIPVLHAFRESINKSEGKEATAESENAFDRLQWLPASMYPEYHKVYEMMADGGTNYPLYKSLPGYTLVDLGDESSQSTDLKRHTVKLYSPSGQLCSVNVSVVAILIGSKPDLSYLENGGNWLCKDPSKPFDCRSNPIEIDNYTYQVSKSPRKGLYALGPLVGDNLVRFILGGAFGTLAHILSTYEMPT